MFEDDSENKQVLEGTERGVTLILISALQLKKNMCKGRRLYAVIVTYDKSDTIDVSQHPILSQFTMAKRLSVV